MTILRISFKSNFEQQLFTLLIMFLGNLQYYNYRLHHLSNPAHIKQVQPTAWKVDASSRKAYRNSCIQDGHNDSQRLHVNIVHTGCAAIKYPVRNINNCFKSFLIPIGMIKLLNSADAQATKTEDIKNFFHIVRYSSGFHLDSLYSKLLTNDSTTCISHLRFTTLAKRLMLSTTVCETLTRGTQTLRQFCMHV